MHLQIPDHQLIKKIGQGSYGEVWLARNLLGTFRAIKVVFRSKFENERPFLRELEGIRRFEPVSRTHPGFVDVLQIGEDKERGYFYYVMEVADDRRNGQQFDPDQYEPANLHVLLQEHGSLGFAPACNSA